MRKLILTTLAVLALPVAAQAQAVSVTATVQKYLATAATQTLAFGNLTRGVANTVAANDVTKNGQVTVAYNAALNIAVPNSGNITGPGAATMAVTYTCASAAANSSYTITGAWTGAGVDCSGGVAVTAPTGLAYLVIGVGGTIAGAVVDAAPAGNYSGTVTVTVTEP